MTTSGGRDFTVLSQIEREALRLRCTGLNNRGVADKLFVTQQTIKNRMSGVYRKLLGSHEGSARRNDGKISVLCFDLGYQTGNVDGRNHVLDEIDKRVLQKRSR